MSFTVPAWVQDAIFYQIFPDRFARSVRTCHPASLSFKPWGSPPEKQGFQGGDLFGIAEKLDYLQELGVNALYLNPIFASAANHRYHTYDYYRVDPLLGGDQALRELLDQAHARGMRVVLDGVFNHTGRGFWAFHHLLENGPDSPYLDWFKIRKWPPAAYGRKTVSPPDYDCWASNPALPKLNTDNPAVQEYILEVARYWIDFGIDGWRLDVPEEIKTPGFWERFREVVKAANPEAWLCGEIWHAAPEWLAGGRFDSLMNYPFSLAVLGFAGARTLREGYRLSEFKLAPLDAGEFSQRLDSLFSTYNPSAVYAQLNLLGSHDTGRALWMLGGDKYALRLAVLLQMTLPGAPCIYYGDEIGMSGAHEPGCRAAFPWDRLDSWDSALLEFYREAAALRHRHPCLRAGAYFPLHASGGVYAFGRRLEGREIIVALNCGLEALTLDLELKGFAGEGRIFEAIRGGKEYAVHGGRLEKISIPARQTLVLSGETG